MCVFGWPITLLLFPLLGSATSSPVSTLSPTSLRPQFSPPSSHPPILSSLSSPSLSAPSPTPPFTPLTGSSEEERCTLMISPSTLVVRFGDPVTANCSVPTMDFSFLGWEVELGAPPASMTRFLVWRVDNVTEWSMRPMCYAGSDQGGHCYTWLDLTVYKPPDSVSISYVNHSGPVLEGHQYTLQCNVQDVAPVENLAVTFYRGQAALGPPQSRNNTEMTPVTEIFTLNINSSREDDGVQYWCEAKLDLGPEGPQLPPVVMSQNLTASVHYGPQFLCPTKVQVREGEALTCEVRGNPHPLVTWLRDGQVVAPPNHSSRKHAGKYTVWATGALGRKNLTLEVEILTASGTSNTDSRHFLVAVLLIQLINWL
ncbi:intercellular adhesion molecule 4-like isoform X1 [Centroberyx affinis]|uniref:intercellular adhesion molecule 4-like isoform X1 n=1 Tax=Centroberyx affinis TaxID=166261 RepID=UPI003A5BD1B3